MNKIKIDIHQPVSEWYKSLLEDLPDNDFIILCDNRDDLTWFTTHFAQLMARQGGNEVACIY